MLKVGKYYMSVLCDTTLDIGLRIELVYCLFIYLCRMDIAHDNRASLSTFSFSPEIVSCLI